MRFEWLEVRYQLAEPDGVWTYRLLRESGKEPFRVIEPDDPRVKLLPALPEMRERLT